jgi:hypothetical protein
MKSKKWELTSVEFISIVDLGNMAHQPSKEQFLLPDNAWLLEDNTVIK